MSYAAIFYADTQVELKPSPIRPEWIIKGAPMARNAEISQGRTKNSTTFVWDCTAGTFDWFYDTDEIVHVLEGSVLLRQDGGPVRRIEAGGVVFFPAGSSARWEVETYVRKLAFFSRRLPKPLEVTLSVLRGAKALLRPGTRLAGEAMPAMSG